MDVPLSCRHCGKPAKATYRCSECDGAPLCLACAIEGGLLGLEVLVKQRAAAEKAARIVAFRARMEGAS